MFVRAGAAVFGEQAAHEDRAVALHSRALYRGDVRGDLRR